MDFTGGLASVGKFIADREPEPHDKLITNRVKRTKINGNNIYNSHNTLKYRRLTKKKANDRYVKATKPMETGIIPNFYILMYYGNCIYYYH
jgi:hypothetical protein